MAQLDEKVIHEQDVKILHDMGYAQELSRRMKVFSNFAISFSIICILSGGINSLGQATSGTGGAAIGFGWPLGVAISGVFALALAQISSACPTAGGLYHWGSIVVSCTVIFLFLSFTVPIILALFTYGTAKFQKPGPWDLAGGLFRLVCILSIIAMGVIFYADIQPPNDWALPITVGFLVLSLLIWVLFENRRFKGPPIGEEIKRRQAEIKAAEAALGGAG
jgi:amino acid transporter